MSGKIIKFPKKNRNIIEFPKKPQVPISKPPIQQPQQSSLDNMLIFLGQSLLIISLVFFILYVLKCVL